MNKIKHDKSNQRQCLITKEVLPKCDLLRFVLSPDGEVVFDVNGKLPGKGMWVKANKAVLEKAISNNGFRLKDKNIASRTISTQAIANQLKQHLLGLLSIANKAGLLYFGQERISSHLDRGEIFAILMTKDSSQNSKNKVQSHIKKNISIIDCFLMDDLSLIFPNDKIGFIGMKSGKITDNFIRQSKIYNELNSD